MILSVVKKILDPFECRAREEHTPCFATLSDDINLGSTQFEGNPIEAECLRYPQPCCQQYLHKNTQAKTAERMNGNSVFDLLHLRVRQKLNIWFRTLRESNLLIWIEGVQL